MTKQLAHDRYSKIVQLRNLGEEVFLKLGEELYYFEMDKAYLELGYPSFRAFCADPAVDITERTAYRLIRVYQTFVLQLGVPPIELLEAGTTKLDMIAGQVDENNYEEWLSKAQTLSKSDLIAELKENGKDYEEPPLVLEYDKISLVNIDVGEGQLWKKHVYTLSKLRITRQGRRIQIVGELADG